MERNFHLKTQNDFDFFEVTSALQKTIRRGEEHEALYWAMEMLPRYEFYLWRRLKIISNEDIGIANPQVIILVQVLSEQYFELRERGDMGCVLMVANAILSMCRSNKSRLGENIIDLVIQEREQGILRLEIPDYALDMHTIRGKAMGRGLRYFKEHGAKLNNKDINITDPYEERAYKLEASKEAKELKWPKLKESSEKPKQKRGSCLRTAQVSRRFPRIDSDDGSPPI